jgi:hypothetical protein
MRAPSRIRLALVVLLAIGFAYAGAATARRYVEIYRSSTGRSASSSIDAQLAPARIAGADALRRAVADAGWRPGEEVLVLARASAVTPAELNQIFFATGYLLYPSRVRVGAWCDAGAALTHCKTLEAHDPESTVARYGAQRVVVIGGENPFPSARWAPLSNMAALASLP